MSSQPKLKYECPKCKCNEYEIGEMHVSAHWLQKILDWNWQKYTAVTCERCRYTELFKTESSKLENIFDVIIS